MGVRTRDEIDRTLAICLWLLNASYLNLTGSAGLKKAGLKAKGQLMSPVEMAILVGKSGSVLRARKIIGLGNIAGGLIPAICGWFHADRLGR